MDVDVPGVVPRSGPSRGFRLSALLILALLAFALLASNGLFGILDDEVLMLDPALRSASSTIQAFASHTGQHEHPPLSDLFLHAWLQLVPGTPTMLRLPFVLCFAAGIWGLGEAARVVAGVRGFAWLIVIAALWPFGFHFGRTLGWYTIAFLLVSALLFAYVKLLQEESNRNFALFASIATLLIYTNYFGWAVIGCLGLDYCWVHRKHFRAAFAKVAGMVLFLSVVFAPLWRPFFHLMHGESRATIPAKSRLFNLAFQLYSVFASEAIAPWFFFLSIPLSLAVMLLAIAIWMESDELGRRLCFYFVGLMAVLAVLGALFTKRILFVSPLLLLPVALAASRMRRPATHRLLVSALVAIAVFGWFGIIADKYYSSTHFRDPWPKVSSAVASEYDKGAVVVGNHVSFFYYFHRSLGTPDAKYSASYPEFKTDARIFNLQDWNANGHPGSGRVLLVEGATGSGSTGVEMESAEAWLQQNCVSAGVDRLAPDTGYELKQKFFAGTGQRKWRVEVLRYDCR